MRIVDTNVLVAAANQSEERQGVCSNLLRTEAILVVPAPVVTETSIMLSCRHNCGMRCRSQGEHSRFIYLG